MNKNSFALKRGEYIRALKTTKSQLITRGVDYKVEYVGDKYFTVFNNNGKLHRFEWNSCEKFFDFSYYLIANSNRYNINLHDELICISKRGYYSPVIVGNSYKVKQINKNSFTIGGETLYNTVTFPFREFERYFTFRDG